MKKIPFINSRDHKLVKEVVGLHKPHHRQEMKQFIAEGWRICTTLIENGLKPDMVFITDEALTQLTDLFVPFDIYLVADLVMDKMTCATTPSGVLAVFPMLGTDANERITRGIVLSEIADPGNMGTLIRTAAAMNIKDVVIVDGCDPYNPKVVQATAGTLAQVRITQTTVKDIKNRIAADSSLCALVVHDGKKPSEINFDKALIIIGNEAHGISPELLALCDQQLTLPMPGNTESLNAAVAGSIAMYLMAQ